jgi:hypothetical protein
MNPPQGVDRWENSDASSKPDSSNRIVGEVESGLPSVSAASRKYQISGSVIGELQGSPTLREKALDG